MVGMLLAGGTFTASSHICRETTPHRTCRATLTQEIATEAKRQTQAKAGESLTAKKSSVRSDICDAMLMLRMIKTVSMEMNRPHGQ